MYDFQLAVLSDIHGNRWALEAVLNDIQRRGIANIVNLGDCVFGPLDPKGTADLLRELNLPAVSGNEDRIIFEPIVETEDLATLQFVRESLTPEHMDWLKGLKQTEVAFEDYFLCHGSPQQDDEYLLRDVLATGVILRSSKDLMTKLRGVEQKYLLCGHDHVPQTLLMPNGLLIVNPGSVGLPAYTDDFPYPHVMESGAPHARYSILMRTGESCMIDNVAVPYDWEAAANAAMQNGRPDWTAWLRTGRGYV